jgi:alpha/beta superfamily hydrolase
MPLRIETPSVSLEAVLREPRGAGLRGAAVLCHPHPQYGGTMDNRVVYRAGKGAVDAGFAALRFNFRGVGGSTGSYDGGEGEQSDVSAAIAWLRRTYPELPLALIGFSFGAWVGLRAGIGDPGVGGLVGIGLPLAAYDFSFLAESPKPALYIVGTQDELCPKLRMEELARRLPAAAGVRWIDDADHFFVEHLDELQEAVAGFLRTTWPEKHRE